MEKKYYDLTSSQNSIWLTEEYISDTNMNNVGGYLYINEVVDFTALNKALNLYIEKNDALRLRFCIKNGNPKQYLTEYEFKNFKVIPVDTLEDEKECTQALIDTPFNIIDSELFRINIFKFPNGHGGFNANFHHLVSDAWTMSLFLSEVISYYSSLVHGKELVQTPFPSYIDYISQEKEYMDSKRFQKDKEFWNGLFDSEPIFSHISSEATSSLSTASKRISFELPSKLYNLINELCQKYKCSIYTFFMAIYSIYIAKLNNNHSPIVGTPVLNRSNYKEKNTSGMFISTVPFRTTFSSEQSFSSYLQDVALTQLSIFRHQKYPYDVLLKDIKEKFSISENLYDLVLSYQNARDDSQRSDVEYSSNWLFSGHISNSLEIHFYDMDNTGTLNMYYDYQLDKFSEAEIHSLHKRIIEMTNIVLDNSDICIKDIPVITKDEQNKFLNEFNFSKFDYDKTLSITKILEDNVKNSPNTTAVIFEEQKLTYAELNNMANVIANKLISSGIKKNEIIGIMLNRSLDLIPSVWGVLKSGATYMLIDPALPTDRINYMLSNSHSPLLITSKDLDLEFKNKIYLEDIDFSEQLPNPNLSNSNEDGFCVIYTSGSTGTPKGVLLKRLSFINMVNSYKKFLCTDTCNTFLSTSTVAFDMFIVENFVSLLSGKTVVLANNEEQKVPAFMSKLIKRHNIDFVLSTPSKIELLLLNDETSSCLEGLKVIQLGGEVFKQTLYNRLRTHTNAKIYNGYGPSECTACASNKEITDCEDITIGKPFLNTRIYVFNDDLNMLPVGFSGEMYISGDGVGKGYVNRQELTQKSFLQDPFSKNIMYKTGDMAKYRTDGELVYIGRKDFQVKLRGLRIELDEITNKIVKLENVINAISVVKKVNNIDCICSYVVCSGNITEEYIKNALKQALPYYMVPSHIVFMESLPITLNGKIDTQKLPEVEVKQSEYIAPSTETEKKLETIWCNILDMEQISINSDFFDLGGDSLCSIKLVSEVYSVFNTKINIKDIFKSPTIKSLAEHIDASASVEDNSQTISKADVMSFYPLSSAQKRIYFTINMEPDTVTYNTPGALLFNKHPDAKKLEKCFNILLNRHCAFRTYFTLNGDEVVQKILPKIDFKLEVTNLDTKNLENIFESFVKPFDLSKAPLFRAKLYNFKDFTSALFIDMHHIICDGESVGIFVDELCALYNGKELSPNTLDYTDYAVWENKNIESNYYDRSKKFWLKQLEGELPVLNMPASSVRPTVQSFEGNKIYKTISNNAKILEFCKKYNATPFTFLLSVYYIALYKYTNQSDIIVGSPIIGRDNASLYKIIGMFVNSLALRAKINSKYTFSEFLRIVTTNCFNCFEHQSEPFDDIVKSLNISRDTSRNPLFDTMFIYQNEGQPEIKLDGLDTTYYAPDDHSSKFDFSLEVTPDKDNLNLCLEYCTKLFNISFMQNFLDHYINILNIVLDEPNTEICNINMLSIDEKDTILNKFNEHVLDYPINKSIMELFENTAKRNSESTALIYKDTKMSYKELDEASSKFATYLCSLGVKKGEIVATLLNRSSNLIVAMLGIMKCGAVYLPISTALPQNRIEYILSDSKTNIFVIDNNNNFEIDDVELVNIEKVDFENIKISNDMPIIDPEDVLYIIYTSGSTGNPKGVQIANKNLNNFIHSFNKLYDYSIGNKDICLSSTSISFDVSIWEFFFTLLNGGALYLYPHESIDDIIDYCNTIIKNNITMAYLPPNILQEVYSILAETKICLNKILVGVEPIKTEIMKKYFELNEDMKIVNGYGPTETTICCTAYVLKKDADIPYNVLPIGRPLYNLKAYVLDKDLEPVPFGANGELYISGDNVGKGYLNRDELNSERYIPCKFNDGNIMYKTGDVVKWLPDGNIIFVGRNDKQIKIKGHRIELNEISSTILEYPTITKCKIIVKEKNNDKYLLAFFTASKKIVINDLRMFLSLKLPFYSIPNIIMQLDHFVLTPNGKIDSHYLENMPVSIGSEYEAPRNDFEKKLVELWKQYLGVDKVGINDNFFELGGDSLIAIKLQIEIFKLGMNITYSDIFTNPTIKELSNKTSRQVFESHLEDYDYSNIDGLIHNNIQPITEKVTTTKLQSILLTGVTGFVGIHVLAKLLDNTDSKIYCLIRRKDNIDIGSRLIKTLHFYFGDKYDTLIGNRIKVVEGDIVLPKFNLSDELYAKLGRKISCIINSAAIVKHYGSQNLFDETNVKGVQNIIDFCSMFGVKLYHISTLSVSGNVFAEDNFSGAKMDTETIFRENNLFINQDLSNIYIYTKFIAERLILENIAEGKLKATIIRLGNITSRYIDGKFQINVSENAFLNRLIAFINLKYLPDYLIDGYLEFSPVDFVAEAISKIVNHDFPYTVFHLYNNRHVSLVDVLKYLKDYGIEIDAVDNKKFLETIAEVLKNNQNILSGIINDFDENKMLVYKSNVTLNNDFTNKFLSKIGFAWPEITEDYIVKYLDYLKDINYLK